MRDMSVLLVEDQVDLRQAMQDSLKRNHCNVIPAGSVREASAKIKNQAFDLVLLDIQLGEESGEEVLALLREERRDQLNLRTPVVLVSGHLEADLIKSMAGKVQGALVKPFEIPALMAVVEKFRPKT